MVDIANVLVPQLGESVANAVIATIVKNVGDQVKKEELLITLETDKVTLEVTAPVDGVLTKLNFAVGDEVNVGEILAEVSKGSLSQNSSVSSESKISNTEKSSFNFGKKNSPAAEKIMSEKGVNSADVSGSGKDGRITKADVLNINENTKSSVDKLRLGDRGENRVKMSRLRLRIAERLKSAQNDAAILTTFNEVNMSAVMKARSAYKDIFEKQNGVKLGFMSFFVKAVVSALQSIPAVNAEIDIAKKEVVYKDFCNIGVAVGTDQGLVVPVIRNADLMSMAQIEAEIVRLGKKARDGNLTMEDMSGGTFTISNGGVYGSLMSTPILNPPQSGILGMHKIQERPMVVDGKIEICPMMYIALSYDHRIVDGKESVTFLVKVKEALEDPQRLLLGV